MTINIWYNTKTKSYKIRYEGRIYTRQSYLAAKELIDLCASDMERNAKENALNKLYEAA